MWCVKLQELEYLTEDMACCHMKVFAGHHQHAVPMWVSVKNIWVKKKNNVHATVSSLTQHNSTHHWTGQAP